MDNHLDNREEEVDTTYAADEHMGSFISSFVGALADRVQEDAKAPLAGENTPFGIIEAWTPEAPAV